MEAQTLLNIGFACAGIFGGWWMKIIWDSIQGLKADLKGLDTKMNALAEPIVSEQTVTSNGQMTTTVKSPPPLADWGCGLRARYSTDSLG